MQDIPFMVRHSQQPEMAVLEMAPLNLMQLRLLTSDHNTSG
jgi:hypothetical protein